MAVFVTDYIGKLFKKAYGISIKKYIAQEKLKRARELLATTDLSVKQIAQELNYEDENLFTKFFVYHEKISPAAFKKQYGHTHLN